MYMQHCRNSQVCLDYNSNGRRNCSSCCSSSGQSSMLLIDGNMTWFVITQRKDPWTEKGERPADYLLLPKPVGQVWILGYLQFSTIQTAPWISCAVTVFNLALVLSWWLLCRMHSFLPELADVLPQVQLTFVFKLCWQKYSPLIGKANLLLSTGLFFFSVISLMNNIFFSLTLGNLKNITGFEKKCVMLLFSPRETSYF